MKKIILALLVLISCIASTSYSRDYVVYEDDYDYYCDDYDDYVEYVEPDYYIEEPVYYRKPVVKTVIREPRRVYVHSHPASSFFSGLFGFGLGTAFGSAISR